MTEAAVTHTLMGGKLHVYKRPGSRYWQCSTFIGGKNRRVSTKDDSLAHAKDFAEDWCSRASGQEADAVSSGTGKELSARPPTSFSASSRSSRTAFAIRNMWLATDGAAEASISYLSSALPGAFPVNRRAGFRSTASIAARRRGHELHGKPPSRTTIHQEIVVIRQVLKTAMRHGWLSAPPRPKRTVSLGDGKSRIARGSRPPNTGRSTRRHAPARRSPRTSAGSGNASSCTITCCLWPTPAFARTRLRGSSTAMWRSSRTKTAARASLRSMFVASAASATARAWRAQ